MPKAKHILCLFLLLFSCQGPWSYWPDDSESYKGIFIYAHIIAGRPVENICFDRIYALDEIRMHNFAFYESASVKISGTFSGIDTSLYLTPQYYGNHNCFVVNSYYYYYDNNGEHYDFLPEAGKSYELEASITWDSAGTIVTSNFSAKTYIPQKFKIKRIYDLEGNNRLDYIHLCSDYGCGIPFSYLPPPQDMQSSYFIPEYSDDVSGVLVSMIYNEYVLWGENSIVNAVDKMIGEFSPGYDTAMYAKFGDREQVYFGKDIDSIPIIGMAMPARGDFELLFYATTNDYVKYRETYINGAEDSRVKAIYNINGGAGIFTGMLVDTVKILISPSSEDIKLYPYEEAQNWYCGTEMPFSGEEYTKTHRECIEYWDYEIKEKLKARLNLEILDLRNISIEQMRTVLSTRDIIAWCEHRDFPIYSYNACGPALIYYYKTAKVKSSILEREVKNWCAYYSAYNEEKQECIGLF